MLTKSKYSKVSHPSAKYRTKAIQQPLKNTGRKVVDMSGWRVK